MTTAKKNYIKLDKVNKKSYKLKDRRDSICYIFNTNNFYIVYCSKQTTTVIET